MTLIVGNLDCEADFAAATSGRGRRPLRLAVQRTISGAATLLRVFAGPEDRLWTPLPVDPGRLPPTPGSASPQWISGPLPAAAGEAILAWGAGPTLTGRPLSGSRPPRPAVDRSGVESRPASALRRRLESVALTRLATAAEVNHRAFALRTARHLGCALPGARMVGSLAELRRHLKAGGAGAGDGGAWVVKAPHAAAGRLRFIAPAASDPASILDDRRIEARLDRLLRSQGALLFEPWMRRVDDWGCAVWVGEEGHEVLGLHRLIVGSEGRFIGVADAGGELDRSARQRLLTVAGQVAAALGAAGYRGPAGVDSWRFRSAGEVELHPLGEINARLTFGWVWRGWRERLIEIGWMATGDRLELRFGRRSPPAAANVLPLLVAAPAAPLAAWLTRHSPAGP